MAGRETSHPRPNGVAPPGEARREVPATVRAVGRGAVRAVGLLTAPVRPLPDFMVIGAKRGGTTSIFRYLLDHPQILPLFPSARWLPLRADRKGVHYFDSHFASGTAWYRSNFPSRPRRWVEARRLGVPVVCGEGTPYYLFHPLAAGRARAVVPAARLVVALRNPVDRAHSHYNEQRARGMEPLATFAEALAAEPQRVAGEAERLESDPAHRSVAHEHQSYFGQGVYCDGIDRWLSEFPAGQVHILCSEDLFADPQGAYDGVIDFLGLGPHRLHGVRPFNASGGRAFDPGLRAELAERYRPHNATLEARLGRRFGWDDHR